MRGIGEITVDQWHEFTVRVRRLAATGERVEAMEPVYRAADLSTLWLELEVPEEHVGKLATGMPVTLEGRGSGPAATIALISGTGAALLAAWLMLDLARQAAFDHVLGQLDALLAWDSVSDDQVQQTVDTIIGQVRARGDAALVDYTTHLDRWTPGSSSDLEIPRDRLERAWQAIPAAQREAGSLTLEEGQVTGAVVLFHDITEAYEARMRLQQTDIAFQHLAEAARLVRPGGWVYVHTLTRTWLSRLLAITCPPSSWATGPYWMCQ